MTATLKQIARVTGVLAAKDLLLLFVGWVRFHRTGRTPKSAYSAMVSLFCLTGGRSNDLLHRIVVRSSPPVPLPRQGLLETMSDSEMAATVERLRESGYAILPARLPEEWCDGLEDYALREQAVVRVDGVPRRATYVRNAPAGVRYDFDEATVIRSVIAQKLMADATLLALAQQYLSCLPVLDLVAMWWHTSWSPHPDKEAAQFFHFDMDRIKWLKFFFYITDVTPETGPHTFVAGSHRTGGIPRSILRKGQVRVDDAEVLAAYPAGALIELCAPRGTIIVEDTRGLHKGKHVVRGDRLTFQLEYSDSLFGMNYDDVCDAAEPSPALLRMASAHPSVFARYVSEGRRA